MEMELGKYSVIGIIVFFIGVMLSANTYAITASLGNARAIVNVEAPTTLERTLKVNNVNNQTINVKIEALGEFKDLVDVKDKDFSLNSNESKNAMYSINIKQPGNYEIKLGVTFIPKKGQAVGLSAVLVVKASGEGTKDGISNANDNLNNSNNSQGIKIDFWNKNNTKNNDDNQVTGGEISSVNLEDNQFAIISIILIVIVAILGGFYYLKKS